MTVAGAQRLAAGSGVGRGGAAQVGADAGEQLGEPERLDQVVVGAGVEAGDDVELLVAGGEDEDGQVGVRGAQPPADVDAVDVGQAEVEDDELDAVVGRGRARGAPRARRRTA